MIGLCGVIVFGLIALSGVIWQLRAAPSSLNTSEVTALRQEVERLKTQPIAAATPGGPQPLIQKPKSSEVRINPKKFGR